MSRLSCYKISYCGFCFFFSFLISKYFIYASTNVSSYIGLLLITQILVRSTKTHAQLEKIKKEKKEKKKKFKMCQKVTEFQKKKEKRRKKRKRKCVFFFFVLLPCMI